MGVASRLAAAEHGAHWFGHNVCDACGVGGLGMKWLMLVRSTACAGAVLVLVGCQAAPPDASSTEAVATEGGESPWGYLR